MSSCVCVRRPHPTPKQTLLKKALGFETSIPIPGALESFTHPPQGERDPNCRSIEEYKLTKMFQPSGRLKQGDCKLEASQDYVVKSCIHAHTHTHTHTHTHEYNRPKQIPVCLSSTIRPGVSDLDLSKLASLFLTCKLGRRPGLCQKLHACH
jgi:hypothetical protein